MRRATAILAAVVVMVAASGCEPKMTITAKPTVNPATCTQEFFIVGYVTPVTATAKVVLQRTINHVWTDTFWQSTPSDPGQPAVATVNKSTGRYSITYKLGPGDLAGAVHLRVRSSGGGATSPDWYEKLDIDTCS